MTKQERIEKLLNRMAECNNVINLNEYASGLGDMYDELANSSNDIQNVSVSLFDESLNLMRYLAEHQNGAPLIRHEEEYNKTMTEVWDFLEANET